MLPFGSFVPGIMLFVFAFAYILYFGACTLNKTINGNKDNISKEQEYILTEKSSLTTNKTCYYYEPAGEKQDACYEKGNNLLINEQSVFQIIKIPDIPVSPAFHRFSLFSRPPPFSA